MKRKRPQSARKSAASKAPPIDLDAVQTAMNRAAALAQRLEGEQDVEVVRAQIAQLASEHATLKQHHDDLRRQHADIVRENAELASKSRQLEHERDKLAQQVAYLNRLVWGRRSEKLSDEELGQLVLAFGGTAQAAASADPNVPIPQKPDEEHSTDTEKEPPRSKRRHPGRTQLSPDLERVVHPPTLVPDAERTCQCCAKEMVAIGYLEHERVEYVPAKLVVHVERREKLVCKACRGDATTAERAEVSTSRRAGSSLLAHLVESKCDDALPIHRQRDQLLRLGFDMPINTLYSYWSYVTELLRPVAETTLSVVLGDPVYVALDDTSLKVLDNSKKAGSYRGHLWCFTGITPLVAYAFTQTWTAAEVAPWIRAIDAPIQCDDYKGYGTHIRSETGEDFGPLVEPGRRLGCMMHYPESAVIWSRRKFSCAA